MPKELRSDRRDDIFKEYVIARIEKAGEKFEVLVKPDAVQRIRDGKEVDLLRELAIDEIFKDAHKGSKASEEKMMEFFGTTEPLAVAKQIVQRGEIQLTTEQRRQMLEAKRKQIVQYIAANAINPQTAAPHPPQRIENAMEEAKVHIDPFKPVEEQVKEVLDALRPCIPTRFEKVRSAWKLSREARIARHRVRQPLRHRGRRCGLRLVGLEASRAGSQPSNSRNSTVDPRPCCRGGDGFPSRAPKGSSSRLHFDALRESETPMESSGSLRPIVIPGEAVGGPGLKPGPGTYSEGGQVFAAQLGIRNEHDGLVSVTPLNGRYIPQRGDAVIGEVVDLGPSHWLVDINSPYPAPLHATESPWRVEFGDTSRYLKVGDVIMGHVLSVDEIKRVQLTMQEREARRLNGGIVMEISPTKVPRVIGKQGSMISLITELTGCRIYVGQNGRIWLDREDRDTAVAASAIRLIEERAQSYGLTEAVRELIERERRSTTGGRPA